LTVGEGFLGQAIKEGTAFKKRIKDAHECGACDVRTEKTKSFVSIRGKICRIDELLD